MVYMDKQRSREHRLESGVLCSNPFLATQQGPDLTSGEEALFPHRLMKYGVAQCPAVGVM